MIVETSNLTLLFQCNICLDVARDAVVSMCGHLFCWPCLHQVTQSQIHSNLWPAGVHFSGLKLDRTDKSAPCVKQGSVEIKWYRYMEGETPTEKILGENTLVPRAWSVLNVINVSGTKFLRDPRVRELSLPPVILSLGSGLAVAREEAGAGSTCPSASAPSPSLSLHQTSILERRDPEHQVRAPTRPLRRRSYIKCFYGWVNSMNERV